MPVPKRAVVLLSGGLDSTTVLAHALAEGWEAYALSFDYGQRHHEELSRAAEIAQALGAVEHKVVRVDLAAFGGSALTADLDVPKNRVDVGGDIPITYVPARNTVFLSLALAWAETLGARDLFVGVNALDYSGYPDCRPDFLRAFEALASVATKAGVESGEPFRIHAPLLELTKADIVRKAVALGVDLSRTLSCYDPGVGGAPCGACDACMLRAKGFAEAGVSDPALGDAGGANGTVRTNGDANESTAKRLVINEIFHSIQGESTLAGRPCVFVRLTACDLRCSWCDTEYAFYEGTKRDVADVVAEVERFGTELVEITGGEPLLQPAVHDLAAALLSRGKTVMIETGGHRDISTLDRRVRRIVDVKTPSSGESHRVRWENLALLRDTDEVKFVVKDRVDFDFALRVIREHGLEGRCPLLLSPVHGVIEPAEVAAWILESGVGARLQLQLHKLLWPTVLRGV